MDASCGRMMPARPVSASRRVSASERPALVSRLVSVLELQVSVLRLVSASVRRAWA